jgi:DNA mismatch repair protein MLH1
VGGTYTGMGSRYAVHNTNVAFTLKKHGAAVADVLTSAQATQVDTIRTIYGSAIAAELVPVRCAV